MEQPTPGPSEAINKHQDVENDVPETKHTEETIISSISTNNQDDDLLFSNPPKFSLIRLFWYFFYNFGLFAWGGPVAQIAMIKQKIVVEEKWITLSRFQRVFAVYQILPGPEAAELCMFFGCLSNGRIGGIIAGLAFILPGFVLMLLASYLYTLSGLENVYFNASFRALQPIVAAMVILKPNSKIVVLTMSRCSKPRTRSLTIPLSSTIRRRWIPSLSSRLSVPPSTRHCV